MTPAAIRGISIKYNMQANSVTSMSASRVHWMCFPFYRKCYSDAFHSRLPLCMREQRKRNLFKHIWFEVKCMCVCTFSRHNSKSVQIYTRRSHFMHTWCTFIYALLCIRRIECKYKFNFPGQTYANASVIEMVAAYDDTMCTFEYVPYDMACSRM